MIEELSIDSGYYSTTEKWKETLEYIRSLANKHRQTISFYYFTESDEKLLIEQFAPENNE